MERERFKQIKLVVSDIDGTLMETNRLLSGACVQLVNRLQEQGVDFTFASGRLPYKIIPLMEQLHSKLPFVACNGACVCEKNGILYQKKFALKEVQALIRAARQQGDTVLYSFDGVEYCMEETVDSARKRKERGRYYPIRPITEDDWEMLLVMKVNILAHASIEGLKQYLQELDSLMVTTYGDKGIELVVAGVDKLAGVSSILTKLHYEPEEVMAIGDNENDEQLLQAVGIGVAVHNAIPSIKATADIVTSHNGEQGVMEILEQLLKAKEG